MIWTAARARGFSLPDVLGWMASGPADLAGLVGKGRIEVGADADFAEFAPDEEFTVDPHRLHHRHPLTPYAGRRLTGVVRRTWVRGTRTGERAGRDRMLTRPDAALWTRRCPVSSTPEPLHEPHWVDLASRAMGGSVLLANDETFAEKENLVKVAPATFTPHTMGPRGQVYDGWETRRRRSPGADWVIVRLGVPGLVRRVVVDTAFFRGNFPTSCELEACWLDGWPPRRRGRRAPRLDGADAASAPGRRHGERRGGRDSRCWRATSGSRSTRTAAWPGCGCSARSCRTRGAGPA